MRVIATKRSTGRIHDIASHGTKRQRAKYRNAYVTICAGGYIVGQHYGRDTACLKAERRLERAERRRGAPVPAFIDNRPLEPAWRGIAGRRGFFWTIHEWSGQTIWVGRTDWY